MQLKVSQDVVPGTIILSKHDGDSRPMTPVPNMSLATCVTGLLSFLTESDRAEIAFLLVAQENYDEVKACL